MVFCLMATEWLILVGFMYFVNEYCRSIMANYCSQTDNGINEIAMHVLEYMLHCW